MNLMGNQWLISLVIGLLIGWILPAAMKETLIMPYGKSIVTGIIGALIGAILYGLFSEQPTNGLVILWSIIGGLALYFIVRSSSNKNQTPDGRPRR